MRLSKDSLFLVGGILMILLGFVMIISPEGFTSVFSVVIGVAVVLEGCLTLFAALPEIEDEGMRLRLKIRGLLGIAVGLLAVFLPLAFAGVVWTVMLYVLGAEMLVSAWLQFSVVRQMKEMELDTRESVIEIILLLAFALFLFIFPFQIGILLVRIIGGLVIVGGGVALYRWKNYLV